MKQTRRLYSESPAILLAYGSGEMRWAGFGLRQITILGFIAIQTVYGYIT